MLNRESKDTNRSVYSTQNRPGTTNIIIPEVVSRLIQLSELTVAEGRFPYVGALIYRGEIIAEATNSIFLPKSLSDLPIFEPPEAHPELRLASEAVYISKSRFPNNHTEQLNFMKEITLYSNCQPCLMCTLALAGAQICKLVYLISDSKAAEASKIALSNITPLTEIFSRFGIVPSITGPIEENLSLVPFKLGWEQVHKFIIP